MTEISTSTFGTPTVSASANQLDKLKSAAHSFEAVFMRQMIKSMRSANLGDGLFDSDATKQFQDMSDSNLADSMASKGTLGIAEMLVKQFQGTVTAGQADAVTDAAGKAAKVPAAPATPVEPLP